MDILLQAIVANPVVSMLVLIGIIFFVYPRFKANITKDGFQSSDITDAICGGFEDYKKAAEEIETVIDDITINDADTVKTAKTILQTLKLFK